MIGELVRSVWTEPRAQKPPVRVWRDWALVAVLGATAVLENVLRPDIPWRPVAVLECVALAFVLLWRRTHPLATVAVGFGLAIVVDVASLASHTGAVSLYTMAFLLLLPYTLFRWGSGREAAIGSAIALAAYGVGIARDHTTVGDAIVGLVLLVFPAFLGATVRIWATARMRELDQVRLREREQLARELHDTVAHHVSAMVIRAQAGRVVAQSQPGAAVEALEIIEAEGSRTLAEMRTMVGALRDHDRADLAPQRGVADIERLARTTDGEARVEVHMSGDLNDLSPSIGAATYRIAQESVTNAVRHARHASRIVVVVVGDDECIRLTVRDDGELVSTIRALDGYGIVGMTERATLLGGTLEVGPGPDRGWVVDAVLPEGGLDRVTIRVLVADDQELVRTGLQMILDAQPGIEVIAVARDGREAVTLARELRPDVCLFDIRMPEVNGLEATRMLAGPDVEDPMAVVVITTFDLDEYVHGALKAGARGFLLKDAGPELLTQAIHAAANGEALIAPNVTVRLLAAFADMRTGQLTAQPVEPLTTREEEVLLTVARGLTNAEIADELHISLSTVKTHLASLMGKLGARNRVEIAMWAYETKRITT